MKYVRWLAMWAVWKLPLGRSAPHVLAFALNCKSYKRVSSKETA